MANKLYNVNLSESINTMIATPANLDKSVDRKTIQEFSIVVSRAANRVNALTAVVDPDSENVDIPTISSILSLFDGSPTGDGISITAGTKVITGVNTTFTSDGVLAGMFIFVPGNNEWGRIASVDSETQLTLEDNFSQTLSGVATWDIYDSKFGITGGLVGALSVELSKVEASNDTAQIPSTWEEVDFDEDDLLVDRLNGSIPQHIRFTLSVNLVDLSVTDLDELSTYNFTLLGNLASSEYSFPATSLESSNS